MCYVIEYGSKSTIWVDHENGGSQQYFTFDVDYDDPESMDRIVGIGVRMLDMFKEHACKLNVSSCDPDGTKCSSQFYKCWRDSKQEGNDDDPPKSIDQCLTQVRECKECEVKEGDPIGGEGTTH